MTFVPVNTIRNQLILLLKTYFHELKDANFTIDTTLDELNLGDTWLIEFVFIVEDRYHISITMDMAKKHFVRIRNAAKYLSRRDLLADAFNPVAE